MDGATLLRDLREILQETSSSTFLTDRTSYDYLYAAATDLSIRTKLFTSTQSITTVVSQTDYDLNYDFLDISLIDNRNRKLIRYNDGTSTTSLYWRDCNNIILADNTTNVSIPYNFTVVPTALVTKITGTTTSAGASSGGECTLADTTANFINVHVGDIVHNTTDGSNGVVVSVISTTALGTALFDGTSNDWTSADAYVLTPQSRYALKLDPPPSTASHTITVYYTQLPNPVYSLYRAYNFPMAYRTALVSFAAFLYKYRDGEPDYGNSLYKVYDMAARKAALGSNMSLGRSGLRVNFVKRANKDSSYR